MSLYASGILPGHTLLHLKFVLNPLNLNRKIELERNMALTRFNMKIIYVPSIIHTMHSISMMQFCYFLTIPGRPYTTFLFHTLHEATIMMISRCVIAVLIAISCLTRDAHSQVSRHSAQGMCSSLIKRRVGILKILELGLKEDGNICNSVLHHMCNFDQILILFCSL